MKRSVALVLALLMALLIGAISADYFLRHPMYETGDAAANSLSVIRAKHFAELYGAYSRWGFHHPGPAFFYVQAFGEWLFYNTLRIVPAPFNGQLLIAMMVAVGFFVAALQVFIRWLPSRCRWWFFPLALALGTLHFGAPLLDHGDAYLSAGVVFGSAWSAHEVVLPFLCLLAAGASVAAGRGEDLPLLVLAGGCLVHSHVAQPLFVLPCALSAYTGFIAVYALRPGDVGGRSPGGWQRLRQGFAAAWRDHRRAQIIAGALLAVFLLPMLVDLTRGPQSNLAAIWHHLQTHRGEHKPLEQSFLYFLQFGAYSAWRAGADSFEKYDPAAVQRYLLANAPVYAAWTVAFGLAAWVLVKQVWSLARKRATSDADRFLAWAAVYLFAAVVLTLKWGTMQDGEMYYFNAWFNFSIYFFAALLAGAVASRLVLAWIKRLDDRGAGLTERGVTVLAALLCMAGFGVQLRMVDSTWSTHFAMHDRVARVITDQLPTQTVKFLNFPQLAWPYTAGVAVQLGRAHERYVVPARWQTMFGPEHTVQTSYRQLAHLEFQKWSFIQPTETEAATKAGRKLTPLEEGVSLAVDPPVAIDLNDGKVARLDFRADTSPPDFEVVGWSGSEPWGEWTDGPRAVLMFRAAPVNGDVELAIDGFPFLNPAHRVLAQRLRVTFNGERVGPEWRLDQPDPPPAVVTIPAAVWNRVRTQAGSTAILELDLPDAVSPQSFDPSTPGDPRRFALGTREMRLRLLHPAPPPPPTAGAEDPHGDVFDGKPVDAAKVTGIFADGWAAQRATVVLPRDAGSQRPFLRVEGVAPERAGITFPYRFIVQAGPAAGAEAVLPAPGPFECLVPLATGDTASANLEVHLTFPQTFVPSRTEPGSQDNRELSLLIHSLGITGDAQPVLTCPRQGWYGEEKDAQAAWRWGRQESGIELAADRAGTLVVSGEVGTQAPDNHVDLLLDGQPVGTVSAKEVGWSPLNQTMPVTAGKHTLTFRSRLPGVHPPGDDRTIALGLKNPGFRLESPPAR